MVLVAFRANCSLQVFVQFLVFVAFIVICLHPFFLTEIDTNEQVWPEPYETAIFVSQNAECWQFHVLHKQAYK